jgi:hypothetical protein
MRQQSDCLSSVDGTVKIWQCRHDGVLFCLPEMRIAIVLSRILVPHYAEKRSKVCNSRHVRLVRDLSANHLLGKVHGSLFLLTILGGIQR